MQSRITELDEEHEGISEITKHQMPLRKYSVDAMNQSIDSKNKQAVKGLRIMMSEKDDLSVNTPINHKSNVELQQSK